MQEITTSYHEKGRHEGKIEVAKKLLELNLDIEKIITATGLTEEEIKQLDN